MTLKHFAFADGLLPSSNLPLLGKTLKFQKKKKIITFINSLLLLAMQMKSKVIIKKIDYSSPTFCMLFFLYFYKAQQNLAKSTDRVLLRFLIIIIILKCRYILVYY